MDDEDPRAEPEDSIRWLRVLTYFALWTLLAVGAVLYYGWIAEPRSAYQTECVGPTGPAPCSGSNLGMAIIAGVMWSISLVILVAVAVADRRLGGRPPGAWDHER